MKPYSEACEQNKDPIIEVIAPLLANAKSVLEIGSGTGQHAVFFAKSMPHLIWQTSDRVENHAGISQWINEAGLDNVELPLSLDVNQQDWPNIKYDAVFSANAVHIMSWHSVENMFSGIGKVIADNGLLILYGPFNYHGDYTSESNRNFDVWLKQRNPESAIRDFEKLDALAMQQGLSFVEDYAMPANNRVLCWKT